MQQKYSVTEIELLAIVETIKEFKGMLWGQDIKVVTDHKNLTRDALGLTSDRVYHWQSLLEEYAPKIIYIKGIHNTVADAILQLDYDPTLNTSNNYTHTTEELSAPQWKLFAHHLQSYNKSSTPTEAYCFHMNEVFANRSKENKIHHLTIEAIAEAQRADASLKHLFNHNAVIDKGLEIKLIENTTCVCKDSWPVISKPLQVHVVKWYHHYLQHPGHTHLEVMMNTAMYWKGMHTTIQSLKKSCRSCQINKRRNLKYGHLPPKTVISYPWGCLCVDLICPYTLQGKDNLQTNFMALTMISPSSSWFEIMELPIITQLHRQIVNGKKLHIANKIIDKTLDYIATLTNKTLLSRYPWCCYLIYNNRSDLKLYFKYLCKSYGI
jgi:hypothetical protein